jgi:hypothetical protein
MDGQTKMVAKPNDPKTFRQKTEVVERGEKIKQRKVGKGFARNSFYDV